MSDVVLAEHEAESRGGVPILVGIILVGLVAVAGIAWSIRHLAQDGTVWVGVTGLVVAILVVVAAVFVGVGLYTVQPNQSRVLTLFGDYRGSDRTPGLRWANPLTIKEKVSLRVRNFTTETSKVNDANGNPIMIAAVVV